MTAGFHMWVTWSGFALAAVAMGYSIVALFAVRAKAGSPRGPPEICPR